MTSAARRLWRRFGRARRSRTDPRRFLLELLPRGSAGAEIGVHLGGFSALILGIVRPRKLHLIDPWVHETGEEYAAAWYGGAAGGGQAEMDERYATVKRRFRDEIEAGKVEVHRGTAEALEALPDDSLDWVYIDGNHQYAHVRSDLEISFRKVKPGGFITGDDYGREGWWGDGVDRAVDEFVAGQGVTVVTVRNHQFVLRV